MHTVADIENAIAGLPERDFWALERWFGEQRQRRWDEQMDKDGESGALDFLVAELDEHLARRETEPSC